MKYVLSRMYPGSKVTLEDFFDTMCDLEVAVGRPEIGSFTNAKLDTVRESIGEFEKDPEGMCSDFFEFLATAPRELSATAADYVRYSQASYNYGEDPDLRPVDIAANVKHLGEALDNFTKKLARNKPWLHAYHTAVDTLAVWRGRDNEIQGEPVPRKVQVDSLATSLVGIVTAESDDGTTKTMLSVSDGHYRGAEELRQDYLIDIPECLAIGFGKSLKGRPRGNTSDATMVCLYRVMIDALPLIMQCLSMAKMLDELGVLEGKHASYVARPEKKEPKPMKPEDSPNALYPIGEWS